MRHSRDVWTVVVVAGVVLLTATRAAQAYIDPGTGAVVAGSLAGFLAVFAGFFGIVLWPFRWLLNFICKRTGLPRIYGKIVIIVLTLGGFGYGAYALCAYYDVLPSVFSEEGQGMEVPTISYAKFERVIVLGMDGLDAGLVGEMMQAGELPNFSKLSQEGSFARLQSSNPSQSPVAWSCIATGCNPGKHGIYDFILRDPKTYFPHLAIYKENPKVASRQRRYLPTRKMPGFWMPLSKGGMPVTVIRWPNAFPPDAVNGRFLSGLGIPDICDRLGQYTFYSTNKKLFPGDTVNKMVEVSWQGDRITTTLVGPELSSLTGKREESKLPLSITRKDKRVALALDDKAVGEIGVGEWSPWTEARFGGGLNKANGIVRFLLMAMEPDFKLYATAIQVDPMEPMFPITEPDGYARELAEKVGRYFTLGMPEDVKAYSENVFSPDDFLSMCKITQQERDRMFDYELGRFEKGLFAFVYDCTDRKQHMFWATRDPDHPAYRPEYAKKYGHVIPDVYRRMDGVLGKVMERLDEKTALIALSDHGFNTYRRSVNLNTWLVENGYQTLRTADGKGGRRFMADVDWSKTRAYSLGFNSIYVNLKGRERNGAVGGTITGSEYRRLCDEIAEKLSNLDDPKTKQRAVKAVYQAREIYRGEALDEAPDLIVGFARGYRAGSDNVLGAAPKALFEDNDKPWSGSHLYDPSYVPGIFLSNLKIRRDNPSVIDIAPSVMQCFGIPKPDYMDGEALFDFEG